MQKQVYHIDYDQKIAGLTVLILKPLFADDYLKNAKLSICNLLKL